MNDYVKFVEKKVKTNKLHPCSWCGDDIPKGSYVAHREYMFDGQFHHDWMHDECEKAMNSLDWRDLEDGFELGSNKRESTEQR